MNTPRFAFDDTPPAPTDSQPSVAVEMHNSPTEIGLTLSFSCCETAARVVISRTDFDGGEFNDAMRDELLMQMLAKDVSTACINGGHGGIVGAMDATMLLAMQSTTLRAAWRAHWRTALNRPEATA